MNAKSPFLRTLALFFPLFFLMILACGCKSSSSVERRTSSADFENLKWREDSETSETEAVDLDEYIRERRSEGQDVKVNEERAKTPGDEVAESKAAEAAKAAEQEQLQQIVAKLNEASPEEAETTSPAEGKKAKTLKEIAAEYAEKAAQEEAEGEGGEDFFPFLGAPPTDELVRPEILEQIGDSKSYEMTVEGGLRRLYYKLKYYPSRTAALKDPSATKAIVVNVTQKPENALLPSINVIKNLLDAGEGSQESCIYYPDNDMLIVTTTEEKMKIVKEILRYVVDVRQPQVRISAIVSEVINSKDFQLGFRYSVIGKDDTETTNLFEQLTVNLPPRNFQDLIVGGIPLDRFQGGTFTLSTAEGRRGLEEFTFRALEDMEYARIVSQPSLTVRLGQTARINVGEEVPVVTTSTIVNNVLTINVAFEEVGVKLYITPLIISKDTVHLHILVEVSSVLGFIEVAPNFPAQPRIQRNFSETTVWVRDGTNLLIGGLTTTNEIANSIKIPLLGDIPGLGWLFRSTQKVKSDVELLFLITPEIEPEQYVVPPGSEF
jgi:type II secretory pathway component GspD/PulD (secretin)